MKTRVKRTPYTQIQEYKDIVAVLSDLYTTAQTTNEQILIKYELQQYYQIIDTLQTKLNK